MSGAEEDRKRAARAEQVALFRYQLIREAADPALSTRQRGRLVRELAARRIKARPASRWWCRGPRSTGDATRSRTCASELADWRSGMT